MLIKDILSSNVLIWGMGSEGRAVKEYLLSHGYNKNLYEYEDSLGLEKLHELSAKADVIIRSPGVSIYKPEFLELKASSKPITSSTSIFLDEMKSNHPNTKTIGITGSKGKSTSVSMMYHMMQNLGLKVALGGNIGKPLIELIDGDYDYIICEISSYQASDLTLSPDIVVFTNLFSVHTDWHKGHEGYCRDKVHLADSAKVAIINNRNEQLMQYTSHLKNKLFYGDDCDFYAKEKELFYLDEAVCNIDNLKLSGNHNMENLSGVISAMNYLKLDWRKALSFLPSFEPLPHRLQKVGTVDGVLFINDSISTAPEAAIGGMKSFDDNMAIISGGTINQQDYTEYAKFIEANPKVKIAVTLFQCGPQISKAIRENVKRDDFILIEAKDLKEAVTLAYKGIKLAHGSLVLFSPTAPSFDCYKNFVARGEDFINCVKSLAKN